MSNRQQPKKKDGDSTNRNARVIAAREWFGMNKTAFADFIGMTQPDMTRIENGTQTPPYARIVAATGVSVDWMMGYSDQMWAGMVLDLQKNLRKHMLSLPDEEKQRLAQPVLDQSDRVKFVIGLATQYAPDLFTDRLILTLMHMDPDEYREKVLESAAYMERSDYVRLGDFLGLPVEWFELGDVSILDDARLEEYRHVVSRLAGRGVTPGKLEQLLEVLP